MKDLERFELLFEMVLTLGQAVVALNGSVVSLQTGNSEETKRHIDEVSKIVDTFVSEARGYISDKKSGND